MAERNVLAFHLFNEELGLDVACIREVLKTGRIHALPRAPAFVEGLMNLRGHIIVVVNLGKKFGRPHAEQPPGKHIVVCAIKAYVIGIMIDDVTGVVALPEADVKPIPDVLNGEIESAYISGVARRENHVLVILDLERLFTKDDMQQLANLNS